MNNHIYVSRNIYICIEIQLFIYLLYIELYRSIHSLNKYIHCSSNDNEHTNKQDICTKLHATWQLGVASNLFHLQQDMDILNIALKQCLRKYIAMYSAK